MLLLLHVPRHAHLLDPTAPMAGRERDGVSACLFATHVPRRPAGRPPRLTWRMTPARLARQFLCAPRTSHVVDDVLL
jgi:hypothetical protein